MSSRIMTTVQIFVSVACIGLAAPQLMAQGTGAPPPDSAHRMHHGPRFDLFKGITLSDAQKSQIDSIRTKYHESMESMRKSNSGDRGQMRQLMQSQWTDMRNVLTSDQQTVFDDNMKQVKERMQQRKQSGGQQTP
jgi:Spy/CpxP family protein refolding chaperone